MSKELMDCLYDTSEGIVTLMTILDQRVSTTSWQSMSSFLTQRCREFDEGHMNSILYSKGFSITLHFMRLLIRTGDEILKDTSITNISKSVVKYEKVGGVSFERELHEKLDGVWRNSPTIPFWFQFECCDLCLVRNSGQTHFRSPI